MLTKPMGRVIQRLWEASSDRKETVMTVGTVPLNVFDADLPTLSYGVDETPAEVYPHFQAAQRRAPSR